MKYFDWEEEYKPLKEHKDKVDLIGIPKGQNESHKIIIELDTYRADQISKKFFSRTTFFRDDDVLYVAICYPPNNSEAIKKYGKTEGQKYFKYCEQLTEFINENTNINKAFIGYILQ